MNFINSNNSSDGNRNDSQAIDDENYVTSCIVLCTRYEKMALERIVGVKRCEQMLSLGKTTFMFY